MDFNGNQTVQGPKDSFSTSCKLFLGICLEKLLANFHFIIENFINFYHTFHTIHYTTHSLFQFNKKAR